MESIYGFSDTLKALAIAYLPSVALAIVLLVIGWWLIGRLSSAFTRRMTNIEVSLRLFLGNAIDIVLKIVLVITAAGMIGIHTTSFIAVLGAASLAVGLALQGTLANFAGGVLILLFKPYKVGDVIETQGRVGEVTAIQIFNTILVTLKGETIILPNGIVSNSPIVNFTTSDQATVEVTIQLESGTDVEHLRSVLIPILSNEPAVRSVPAPSVDVVDLSPGAVTVSVKVYSKPSDALQLKANVMLRIKEHLKRAGFKAPVPHTYVHAINENSALLN